jgi:CRP-like cAMP-binding protein
MSSAAAPRPPAGGPGSGDVKERDARTEPRVAAEFKVSLHSPDFSGPLAASARDLSTDGMCVVTRSPIALGSVRRATLQLHSGPLEVTTQGRWQAPSASEGLVASGFSFPGLQAPAKALLYDEVRSRAEEVARFLHFESELAELGSDDAIALAGHSRLRVVTARSAIYRQDSASAGEDAIFALLDGRVSLRHRLGAASEVAAPELRRGAVFGGLPTLLDLPHAETAATLGETRLLEVSRGSLAYLRLGNPMLAERLARIVLRSCFLRLRRFAELAALRGEARDREADGERGEPRG